MKREAVNHTKMDRLMRRLKVPRYAACGLMEMLWIFTARECPTGTLESRGDEDIAIACGWDGDESALVEALGYAKFIERHGESWRVHDWPDHCDHSVNLKLWKERRLFADGRIPKVPANLLNSEERKDYLAWCERMEKESPPTAMADLGAPLGPCLAKPSQSLPSQAEPEAAMAAKPAPPKEPPYEQDFAAELLELQQLWAMRGKNLASDEDWKRFHSRIWRPWDMFQRQTMLEGARVCEGPWLGNPTSWAEGKGWQRRENLAVRAGPTRHDPLAHVKARLAKENAG